MAKKERRRTLVRRKEERTDMRTGEVYPDRVYSMILDNIPVDTGYVKVFKAFTNNVIKDLGIESGKAKLLFWFMDQIQEGRMNQLPIVLAPVDMVAQQLKCSEIAVRKWLRFLIEKKYIWKHTQPNGKIIFNAYVVNPEFIIKGKLSDLNKG